MCVGKEKLSNVTSNLGVGGGAEYVKICDGVVTGGGRGSNCGDFLLDVIKVRPLNQFTPIHTHTHTHTYTYTHIHIHTHTHTHKFAKFISAQTRAPPHACERACASARVCTCARTCRCVCVLALVWARAWVLVHGCACMGACVRACICVGGWVHMLVCACVCVRGCMRVLVCACVWSLIHEYALLTTHNSTFFTSDIKSIDDVHKRGIQEPTQQQSKEMGSESENL